MMTSAPDVTVTLNFHREGALALPALASLADLVSVARAGGVAVETQAILDRADDLTRSIVAARGGWLDRVSEVGFGDLGRSRNEGARLASGAYLAFLDGDDLWGERWLRAAFEAAAAPKTPRDIIWHPEHHFAFTAGAPGNPETASWAYQRQQSTDTASFEPHLLVFHSIWSANAFARREIFLRFPYAPVDLEHGIGIEDWTWNLETLAAGVQHRIVPDTVHVIRRKLTGSLMRSNGERNLLPRLPTTPLWGPGSFGLGGRASA